MGGASLTAVTGALDAEHAKHEHLEVARDPATGTITIVAVHCTALGPAMGGVRRTAYPSLDAAILDALRLSHAMTLKNSLAVLPLGGGKSVIVDAGAEASPAVLDSFAAQLERLGGRYVAAEDIGTSPADMDRIALGTRWVAGRSDAAGGTGDPSPSTARTVMGAMEHAWRARTDSGDFSGARVGVIGAGKVGSRLAAMLAQRGAELLIADLDHARAEALAVQTGGRARGVAEVLESELDVLAPCARGGVIDASSLRRLKAQIVCGAANNILAREEMAEALARAGVLYVPDFLANAGGIVQVGGEFLGWSSSRIEAALRRSVDLAGDVLQHAAASGRTPHAIALDRARARVAEARPARRNAVLEAVA